MGAGQFEITVHRDMEAVKSDWMAFQKSGFCTLEQTFEWSNTWLKVYGPTQRIEPTIVIATDTASGKPAFLLPLCIVRQFGFRKLIWMSTDNLTYGMGIYSDDVLKNPLDPLTDLWPLVIQKIGKVDVIDLKCQPAHIAGQAIPLASHARIRAANSSYAFNLSEDFDALYRSKRSSSTRRSNAKRERNLAKIGDIWFGLPKSASETKAVLDTMFRQQQTRLGARGIKSVFDPTPMAFINALVGQTFEDGQPILLPYHLKIDGNVRAVLLGAGFKKTYWALIASLTADQAIARHSPGETALRYMIKDLCENGFSRFDFSLGDSAYKQHWTDEEIILYETINCTGFTGLPLAAFLLAKTTAKRTLKNNRFAFAAINAIRRAVFGR